MAKVVMLPKVISNKDAVYSKFPANSTLAEIITGTPTSVDEEYDFLIDIDGCIVPREYWHLCKPKEGHTVTVRPRVRGENVDITTILIGLAIVAAALVLGPIVGAALFGSFLAASVASALGTALIGAVGSLLLNALAPPADPTALGDASGEDLATSQTYSLTGAQNSGKPWGVVPLVLGRHKNIPPLAARTYTEIRAMTKQYFRMLVCWGYGQLQITNIKIGNTPIGDFEDVLVDTVDGDVVEHPKRFPNQVTEQSLSIALTDAAGFAARTTEPNTDEASLDIVFNGGLFEMDTETGKRSARTVQFVVKYKNVAGGGFTVLPTIVVKQMRAEAFGRNVHIEFASRGQYEIQVTRTTADTRSDSIIDKAFWTTLRSIRNESPVHFPYGLAQTSVVIRASEQLSGVVSDLNAITTSYAPVWTGSVWTSLPTNNPASLIRLVLQGKANPRPVPDNEIDLEQLAYFSEYCDLKGFEFNMIVDFEAKVFDLCQMIAASALASIQILDGKWTVLIDEPKTFASGLYSPQNSKNFSGDISYQEMPHAFRARFVNETNNRFNNDERIIYRAGYDDTNATIFEALDFPGVTNPDQVYRLAIRHLAVIALRPMNYTFDVGISNLSHTRGERIKVVNDSTHFGLASGRIKSVSGDGGTPEHVTSLSLDNSVPMEATGHYAIRVQLADGTPLLMNVVTNAGEQFSVTVADVVLSAVGPEIGDLFLFGEQGRESVDMIITKIEPSDELNARVTCVDYSPEIYDVDSNVIPDYDSSITIPPDIDIAPTAPVISAIQSDISVALQANDGSIQERVLVVVQPPSNFEPSEVVVEGQVRLVDTDDWAEIQTQTKHDRVFITGVTGGDIYDLRIRFKTSAASRRPGAVSPWTEQADYVVIGKTDLPPDVKELKLEGTRAVWNLYTFPLDLAGFELRVNRGSSVSWEDASPVQDNLILTTEFDLDWLTGITGGLFTVLVKAIDDGGRESELAAAMVINLGETGFANIYKTVIYSAISYGIGSGLGEVTGGTVVGAELHADTAASFWSANSADEFWQPSGELFWAANADEMIYYGMYISQVGERYSELGLMVTLEASEHRIEYHTDGEPLFFTGNDDALIFTGVDDVEALAAWGAWRVWPGKFELGGRQKYFFRIVTAAGSVQGIISQFTINIDVPDIVEDLADVSILIGGTNLPITKTYDVIKSVVLTVHGTGGKYAMAEDKSPTGPLVKVYSGASAIAGVVDARVVGYNV